ncbi:sugar transferase [Chitinophaga sp. SYP-B3965]|uniref:sugar transferase n=1 Tax=Chitinophaga sp. SYP-B3965 TaxID=2663120 RepID=UPI001299F159|nr:sugar transferase [Chitinophaga sp. SYP-B3965]MRG48182.1 sugar transferase [Chitinophaga sp. SYP-B3965]
MKEILAKAKDTTFYYIGENTQKIDLLAGIFDAGYDTDTMENAQVMLNDLHSLPDVIFCESGFSFAAISHFFEFLHNHPVLSAIPFVLDADGLSEEQIDACRKKRVVDEIINLDQKDLLKKVNFLKKTKTYITEPVRIRKENPIGHVAKRAFDIIVSLVLLIALLPLLLVIALIIRIESHGPVLYASKRAGKAYKIFRFYKFRTMVVHADKSIDVLKQLNQYDGVGPVFHKVNNDPRVTRIGAFLRNTSMDELPQLFNVLLGDMSLVGNRPLPLYEANTLTTDSWCTRFLAPAGLTGLWQIKKRGEAEMSVEERINLDIDYAQKQTFIFDMWIIANTPTALIQKDNV